MELMQAAGTLERDESCSEVLEIIINHYCGLISYVLKCESRSCAPRMRLPSAILMFGNNKVGPTNSTQMV